jgi:peptidoglycan/LPS O-acetylase OafA/YrhL
LPALFLVLFVSVLAAYALMLPKDLKEFSQSLVAVASFASNIFFWKKSAYFDAAAELKPLLHTWSLAVEEQYYVLFPIVVSLTWRKGRRGFTGMLIGGALASFMLAEWTSHHDSATAFFLLPTRAWELALGAIVACYLFDRNQISGVSQRVAECMGICGLLLIACAVVLFNKDIPFPGVYALMPTAGAVLAILFVTPETIAGKVLTTSVVVAIGLVSYSAYLWHQPILAFVRYRCIGEPSTFVLVGALVSALLLSYVTWRWVETPWRAKGKLSLRQLITTASVCACALVAVGLLGHVNDGFVAGLSPAKMKAFHYPMADVKRSYREGSCFLDLEQSSASFTDDCVSSAGSAGTLLWGDSHAAALSVGFRRLLPDITQYTASGCPPVIDSFPSMPTHCRDVNAFVLDRVTRIRPAAIFLHANWWSYKTAHVIPMMARTIAEVRRVVPEATVTVIGSVPQWHPSLPKVMLLSGITPDRELYLDTPLLKELTSIDLELAEVANQGGARFLAPLRNLCVKDRCQAVLASANGIALTVWDDAHLTERGSLLVGQKLLGTEPLPDAFRSNTLKVVNHKSG